MIPAWAWLLWVVVGFTMEMVAVFNHHPNDTLTQTTLHYVPGVWILLAIVWVGVHFTTRVWRNRKGKQDGL